MLAPHTGKQGDHYGDGCNNALHTVDSIINLVQMWKEEESRIKLLKMAEMRKKTIEKEIDRLSTMDEVKCKILGISKDEILNG